MKTTENDGQQWSIIQRIVQHRVNRLQREFHASVQKQADAQAKRDAANVQLTETQFNTRAARSALLEETMRRQATVRVLDHFQKRTGELQADLATAVAEQSAAQQTCEQAEQACLAAGESLRLSIRRQEKWQALRVWLDDSGS